MKKREFLQLGKPWDGRGVIAGWMVSHKLDGERCFWDGGVSRGIPKSDIPWANMHTPTGTATGLWSRYGNIIYAPDWFLDDLPQGICLDGELYNHGMSRQQIHSIIKRHTPDDRWKMVQYRVFDIPYPFEDGHINNPNFKKVIREVECLGFYPSSFKFYDKTRFRSRYYVLENKVSFGDNVQVVPQVFLPYSEEEARDQLSMMLDIALSGGYEGLMLKDPDCVYKARRVNTLFKMKPTNDSEGVIVGYTDGKGKYEGMMGAAIVRMDSGIEFKLSGWTDSQRMHPLEVGTRITFKHRGFTDAGIPCEARFWRVWECV